MTDALFADFAPSSFEEWLNVVRGSLRGGSLSSLKKRSYEGIEIHPLPHADDLADLQHQFSLPGQFPFVRGAKAAGYRARPWLIAQELNISDPRAFNQALRDGLANGQTAIIIDDHLRLNEAADLRLALADIDIERIPILAQSEEKARHIHEWLGAALDDDALSRLRGCIGCDPLAALARTGRLSGDAFARMAAHVQSLAERSPQLGSIAVSTAVYHDAGANAMQELALAIASAVEYLRALNERGLPIESAAPKLRFFLNIGENFFIEIAKFRAIKLLWAQVMRAFDLQRQGALIRLHARSGARNKSRLETHVNLLRLTTEALSAAIGGVDSIALAPYDAPLGEAGEFSRRLSRNVQLILQDETRLVELIDPAGGAWYVEKLTDELARAAWAQFQRIEARGGLVASLRAGAIQAEIAAVAARRQRDLANGDAALVGVNRYLDPAASLPPAPQTEAPAAEVTPAGAIALPLAPLRLAAPFETLQHKSGSGA